MHAKSQIYIFTAGQRRCWKLMFSRVSVILSTQMSLPGYTLSPAIPYTTFWLYPTTLKGHGTGYSLSHPEKDMGPEIPYTSQKGYGTRDRSTLSLIVLPSSGGYQSRRYTSYWNVVKQKRYVTVYALYKFMFQSFVFYIMAVGVCQICCVQNCFVLHSIFK